MSCVVYAYKTVRHHRGGPVPRCPRERGGSRNAVAVVVSVVNARWGVRRQLRWPNTKARIECRSDGANTEIAKMCLQVKS